MQKFTHYNETERNGHYVRWPINLTDQLYIIILPETFIISYLFKYARNLQQKLQYDIDSKNILLRPMQS